MFELPTISFTLTTVIFYWLYLILLVFYFLMAFFNIYHLVKFGPLSAINYSVIAVFLFISFVLISTSFAVFAGLDWSTPIFSTDWLSGLGGLFGSFNSSADLDKAFPDIKF